MNFKTSVLLIAVSNPFGALAFPTSFSRRGIVPATASNKHLTTLSSEASAWNGEVASNTADGIMNGCKVSQVEGSMTEWVVAIDGEQADLGKFSEAIYKKITADAKKERFQGFRPGTIPPHLQSTYMGFSIDECAREATAEAMQQNNIRPFTDARNEFEFDTIAIMPPKKKKKKSKKKKKGASGEQDSVPIVEEPKPVMLTFATFKEAISAGWKVSHFILCILQFVMSIPAYFSHHSNSMSSYSLDKHLALLLEMLKVRMLWIIQEPNLLVAHFLR